MKNNYRNAQRFILKHLPNPNRPSIRELEDLLINYANAVTRPEPKPKAAKMKPHKVVEAQTPEEVISKTINR